MKLLDKRVNLDIKTENLIGLAVGIDSWGKSDIRTRQYQLLILCFVIELQTRTTIKQKIVKKNKTTRTAKFVAFICGLCMFASCLAIYEAFNADTGATAYSLTVVSAIFLALFVLVGVAYLAMDKKEKYHAK